MKLKDSIFGLLALLTIASATFAVFRLDAGATLKLYQKYPQWVSVGENCPDQTSGICYINTQGNKKYFLLADDIGELHTLVMAEDTVNSIKTITLSETAKGVFPTDQKWDFEEIVYDRFTNAVYLSVEGNGRNYKTDNGIYKLKFKENNPLSGYVTACEKIQFKDEQLLTKYLYNNIGYEGVTVDSNYFYLGLEGFTKGALFADSTYIYVVEKKSLETVAVVGTKNIGIGTICGLHSRGERSLIGIDRNQMAIFTLEFNTDFSVAKSKIYHHEGQIPGYPTKVYFSSLESITTDEDGAIYVADDPWKKYFVPNEAVLSSLDAQTQKNFKRFIPILYKYNF